MLHGLVGWRDGARVSAKCARSSAPRCPQEWLADESWLKVGQSHSVVPAIGRDDNRVRAFVVAAIDQQAAHAHAPHLAEVIFCA